MAGVVGAASRSLRSYGWLITALVFLALVRLNQIAFFWFQFESVTLFNWERNYILVPFTLGAWTLAWWQWLELPGGRWTTKVAYGLTIFLIVASMTALYANGLRLGFIALLLITLFYGFRTKVRETWWTLPAIQSISVGLLPRKCRRWVFRASGSPSMWAYRGRNMLMKRSTW